MPRVPLHRGLSAIEELLPGLRGQLVSRAGYRRTGDPAWLGERGWAPSGTPVLELVSAIRSWSSTWSGGVWRSCQGWSRVAAHGCGA